MTVTQYSPGTSVTRPTQSQADSKAAIHVQLHQETADRVNELMAALSRLTGETIADLALKASQSSFDNLPTAAKTGSYADLTNKPLVVKTINGQAPDSAGNATVVTGGSSGNVLVLAQGAAVPANTPANTLVARLA